jgi:S-layer homology domain
MKKGFIAVLILSLFTIFGSVAYAASGKSFTDVKDTHWAKKDIIGAVTKGYVDGYPNGTFNPEGTVTKAEFIKMTTAALKYKLPSSSDNAAWYTSYWQAAKDQKLIVNNDLNEQEVNKPITRFEMARVASRAVGDTTDEENKWMYLATSKGLIHGHPGGVLAEDETSTRAQAVAVIERILAVKAGEKLPVDKYAVSSAEIAWHKTNLISMLPRYFSLPYSSTPTFNDKALVAQSSDGNYSCETEKFVVIDLSDPKDPNRKLIPKGTKVFDTSTSTTRDLPKNAYVILSFNKLTVKENTSNLTWTRGCNAALDLEFKGKVNNEVTELLPLAIYDENGKGVISGRIPVKSNSVYQYITGQILPKGDLVPDNIARVYFERLPDFGLDVVQKIYTSRLNETYSQK